MLPVTLCGTRPFSLFFYILATASGTSHQLNKCISAPQSWSNSQRQKPKTAMFGALLLKGSKAPKSAPRRTQTNWKEASIADDTHNDCDIYDLPRPFESPQRKVPNEIFTSLKRDIQRSLKGTTHKPEYMPFTLRVGLALSRWHDNDDNANRRRIRNPLHLHLTLHRKAQGPLGVFKRPCLTSKQRERRAAQEHGARNRLPHTTPTRPRRTAKW